MGRIPGFLSVTCGNCLLACDAQKKALKAAIIGAIFSVIMGLILIPKYGMIGAAIVILLTEFLILIIAHHELTKIIKTNFLKFLIYPLIGSLIMSIFLIIFKNMGILNPVVLIALGMAIYFLVIYSLYRVNGFNFLKNTI